MSSYSVLLDIRERGLLVELNKIIEGKNLPIRIETVPLDVGDIQIWRCDNEGQKTLVALIERKTVQDFYSSIRDGRYAEQKVRFRTLAAPMKLYLIEGDVYNSEYRGKFPADYLLQRLIRLQFMYKIAIVQTPTILRTAEYVLLLIRKLSNHSLVCKEEDEDSVEEESSSYKESISIVKKENMTPATVYYLQLKQIPGFASTSVNAIVSVYPNILALLQGLQTAPAMVASIKINEKRQLGMKAVENLKKYLGVE